MKLAYRTRCVWVLALALVCSRAAHARSPGGMLTDSTVVPIEGITVTGARAPETVLRTPAAVSVVGRERLLATRQISLADGLSLVPGVFAQSRGGAQDVRITIRGYGARGNGERSNAGNMRGIRILTDGVPLTEPDGRTSLDLVDLGGVDQVEVLRSNGSVLYGNAAGGVVNLRSALDFERPWFQYQQRAGAYGFHREQGVLGYTVGRARGTVSVFNSTFDGWRGHSGSSTASVQNRLTTPLDEHTRLGAILDFVSNFNRFPGALTEVQRAADPVQANPTYVARDERRFNRVGRVALSLDRDLPGEQRLTLAAWAEPKVLQRSERNRFRDFNRYHVGGSATWQLQTPLAPGWHAVWSAGADEQFQDGSINFYTLTPDGGRGTDLVANKREGANSAGGFVQGELRWNDRWSFRLAARYDNLWYISEDRIEPWLNDSRHFTQVTPKGSLARTFERHTLYASVGGGVEAPAFNEIDPPPPYDTLTSLNPFLDAMRSTSYEIGAKGYLVGGAPGAGRIDYDLALYWIDVKNDLVPWNGGAYFFTAGKSRRKGGEIGLDWTPVTRLTLRGALTVSDNRYIDYSNELGTFDGHKVAGLPRTTFDGEARWRVGRGLSLTGRIRQVGAYFADDANIASAGAATLLGLGADFALPASYGMWRVFLNADNLADRDYISSVFINGINGEFYEPGLPRSVSAGLSITLR